MICFTCDQMEKAFHSTYIKGAVISKFCSFFPPFVPRLLIIEESSILESPLFAGLLRCRWEGAGRLGLIFVVSL